MFNDLPPQTVASNGKIEQLRAFGLANTLELQLEELITEPANVPVERM